MLSVNWKISRRKLVVAVIVFVVYLLAVKAGAFFYGDGRSSPAIIFPAAGVSIAALFLEGYGFWIIIALASLLNSFLSFAPLPTAFSVAFGSTLQALVGAYVLRRFRFDPRIWRFRDMGLMVGVAMVVTIISPSIGTLVSWVTNVWGAIPPVQRWISWWLGGVLSVMLLTPFLISWITHPKLRGNRKYFLEGSLASIFLVGISFLIYWTSYTSFGGVPLIYVLLVPLFWISLRFGNRETIAALLVTTSISFAGAVFGFHGQSPETLGMRLFQLQILAIILSGIFFIVSAISEERRMAQAASKGYIAQLEDVLKKLRSADKAKTEFIAVLAHELRNPLAPALSSLEFLELQEFSTPEKEEAAMQAKRNIKIMSHLLDDLLDVSRINQGKIRLQKEPLGMADVVDRVVRNAQLLIDSRRHKLYVDVSRDLPPVMADPLRLEQVLTNLLTNAVKYTEPDGKIWISADTQGNEMVVRIRDTGIGISQDSILQIFNMFNQVNRSANKSSEGLGIGLNLAKRLVELHEGTLGVQSEGLGKGSEFIVRLPLSPDLSGAATGVTQINSGRKVYDSSAKARKKRVLIVDDNAAAANALVKLFDRLGHEPRASYNAESGIAAALDFHPDLILLDIGLPDMSGRDMVKKLRNYPEFSKTFIAAVSGYGQDEDRRMSRESGFDQHLVKPVDLDIWRGLLEKI